MIQLFKKHFFAGVLVLIPFGVIVWIMGIFLRVVLRLHHLIPEELRPDHPLMNFIFIVGDLVVIVLAISALGLISKNFIGKKILELIELLIHRIPVIRSIYSALDQLLKTFASEGMQQFSRVVYVEYPRKGMWTLAFVTSATKTDAFPKNHLNVYVPTTPNPTSGFYLIVSESEVKECELNVEQALKTILSLGIASK
jgi:uncharacterized membrane protein